MNFFSSQSTLPRVPPLASSFGSRPTFSSPFRPQPGLSAIQPLRQVARDRLEIVVELLDDFVDLVEDLLAEILLVFLNSLSIKHVSPQPRSSPPG